MNGVIDINKLSKALGVKWTHPRECVFDYGSRDFRYLGEKIDKNVFDFKLGKNNGEEFVKLSIFKDKPEILLVWEDKNKLNSTLSFSGINKVNYNSEFRYMEFINETKNSYTRLKIWQRGQFDLVTGNK